MSDKPKIIFFYFPLHVWYNHGLALLRSILSQKGIEVAVLPIVPMMDPRAILDKFKPDFVGFSFVTKHDYFLSLPTVKECHNYGSLMLAGGPYATMGGYIDPRYFDHVCRGDGEGLAEYILHDNTAVFDSPQTCTDLDALPLPDLSSVTGWEFHRNHPVMFGRRIVPYSSSRGCPHACSFCAVQFQKHHRPVRFRTNARADLELLAQACKPDLVYLMDELPPYYNAEWRAGLEGNRVPFYCYIRADIKSEELAFMVRNGMKACAFGVESGNEQYRNEVLKKGVTDAQIMVLCELLRGYGVQYIPFFMDNPPEVPADHVEKSRRLANRIGGWPLVYAYEHLPSQRFSIGEDLIDRYSTKVECPPDSVRDRLNLPNIGAGCLGQGFYSYESRGGTLFIHDLYGVVTKWFGSEMNLLSKAHNSKHVAAVAWGKTVPYLMNKFGGTKKATLMMKEA